MLWQLTLAPVLDDTEHEGEAEMQMEDVLWSFLPKECHAAWAAGPYRMTSNDAQVWRGSS